MVRIDENQEAIAVIRMAINADNVARSLQTQENGVEDVIPDVLKLQSPERHWNFGSPSGKCLNSRELEKNFSAIDCNFISFDERLRSFITENFPDEAPRYEDIIYVRCYLFFTLSLRTIHEIY